MRFDPRVLAPKRIKGKVSASRSGRPGRHLEKIQTSTPEVKGTASCRKTKAQYPAPFTARNTAIMELPMFPAISIFASCGNCRFLFATA
jgi:hypothetical protein